MTSARYCALVTVGGDGHPQARAIDAFPPEEGLVVWIGTNTGTRKVAQIRSDERVTLYYLSPNADGYVTLLGTAELVDDLRARREHWKESWGAFYEDAWRGDDYVLIRVVPSRVEVMSVPHGIASQPTGWSPAIVDLDGSTPHEP